MKLIIQIPCYNEAEQLRATLQALPRSLQGIDQLEVLIIDDGSRDETAAVAAAEGAHHVIRLRQNRGLANAFQTGLLAALERDADIIVNTDADNQYVAEDIAELVKPILAGKADMVIGERPIEEIAHFNWTKRKLQRLGSAVVRGVSGSDVRDAPSGFRAFSRSAAQKLNVLDPYTYTLETIIQARRKGIHIATVPIRVNPPTRPSRLIRSLPSYLRRSALTIFRIFVTYQPLRFFASVGGVLFLAGFLLGVRFLYYYLTGNGDGKIQSTILAALLMGSGLGVMLMALVADLIAVNRQLLERMQTQLSQLRDELRSRHDEP